MSNSESDSLTNQKKIGERIKYLRQQSKISQEELADEIHVNRAVMSRIENGTRPVRDIELSALADAFSVTTDYLLGKNRTPEWANTKDTNDLEKFLSDNAESMTYGGENITDQEKQQVRVAMTQIFWNRHKHPKD